MSKGSKTDLISLSDVVKRIPKIAPKVPKMLQGLLVANNKDLTKNVGLAWAFHKAVKENPDGIAILFEEQKITYEQLDKRANKVAHYFLSIGVKKGDVVAAYIENRPELLCLTLAMAKIGAVTALVNSSQSGKVLVHSIELVKAKYIVVGEELESDLTEVLNDLTLNSSHIYCWADNDGAPDALNKIDNDKRMLSKDGYQNVASVSKDQPTTTPIESQTVYKKDGLFYIYTSGTTGLPKAVIFNHGRWMKAYGTFGHIADLNKDDVMYVTLPMYHATGIAVCWSTVIKGNATIALRRKFSASSFWQDVHKFNASSFGYVGELCRYLMDIPTSELDKSHRVTKMLGNGMRPNIWHKFKDRYAVDEVFEFYASSEGNIGFSNIFNFENTVGFSPLPYALVQYDKEKNEAVRNKNGLCISVAKGEVGLLLGKITAKTPFDGYTDTEKNKSVVLKDVLMKGDKYFNTGDLMRNMGFKHTQFVDRVGDTFRWKGENVSTNEVENIICDIAAVNEAIVYGVEIEGTNGRAGMVAVTAVDGHILCEDTLSAMLTTSKKSLPHYAVPVFVRVLSTIETTGTFKYSKNKLKEIAFDPNKTDDEIFVCLPKSERFKKITPELYKDIQGGKFRF